MRTHANTARETLLAEMLTNPDVTRRSGIGPSTTAAMMRGEDVNPRTAIDPADDHPDFHDLAAADEALAGRIRELLGLANVALEMGLVGAAEVAIADVQPLIEQRRRILHLVGAR